MEKVLKRWLMKYSAIIMAGGKGERFWPKSRTCLPKQFLSVSSEGKSIIQATVERILPLVDIENIFIVTNKSYLSLVQSHLPDIKLENIILEPVGRNTAPCIALASAIISKKLGDSVSFILSSDHIIKPTDNFIKDLKLAGAACLEDGSLLTLGIKPTHPDTGYGYIEYGSGKEVFPVLSFKEKPNLENARKYCAAGNYLWNSGMFIWQTTSILNALLKYNKPIYDRANLIASHYGKATFSEVIEKEFALFENISIDYAVMEKADNVKVVPSSFKWDDVGSFLALERLNEKDDSGNTILGEATLLDSKNNIIFGDKKKVISLLGCEGLVVVDTEDALLVASKERLQDIKSLLLKLKEGGRSELL